MARVRSRIGGQTVSPIKNKAIRNKVLSRKISGKMVHGVCCYSNVNDAMIKFLQHALARDSAARW